jgi:hypothetical protein
MALAMRVAVARVAVALVAAGALVGCGKFYWTKPGSTIDEFERDSADCARATSPNPTAAAVGNVIITAYRACLTQRGYVRQQHPTPPPDGYRGFE